MRVDHCAVAKLVDCPAPAPGSRSRTATPTAATSRRPGGHRMPFSRVPQPSRPPFRRHRSVRRHAPTVAKFDRRCSALRPPWPPALPAPASGASGSPWWGPGPASSPDTWCSCAPASPVAVDEAVRLLSPHGLASAWLPTEPQLFAAVAGGGNMAWEYGTCCAAAEPLLRRCRCCRGAAVVPPLAAAAETTAMAAAAAAAAPRAANAVVQNDAKPGADLVQAWCNHGPEGL